MKNIQSLSIFAIFLFTFSLTAQQSLKTIHYNQRDFNKNKILLESHDLWSHKNRWTPTTSDTLSYFVDNRTYKGILNYSVTFKSRDFTSFTFLESNTMYFIFVEFTKANFSSTDNIINIEGFVTGGWWQQTAKKSKFRNHIDILMGEKVDTISACYLGNACYDNIINKELIQSIYKGKEIDEYQILDKFPAFYFKDYAYFQTASQGKRPFKIRGKVNRKTLLAFGGRGCYAEIFDIGAMIFEPKKNKNQQASKKNIESSKQILVNNELVSDLAHKKEKEKNDDYFNLAKSAENYILVRQYAKAKEQYLSLFQKYSKLFARDIHNAVRCAVLSRDYNLALKWGLELSKKSIPISYFNSKLLNKLKVIPKEWKPFSIKYDSIYKVTSTKLNLNLNNIIQQLLIADQADYGLDNRKDPKILLETTEKVTNKFIDVLKVNGFPSEEKIGAFIKNDTILISVPDFNVIIRHAVQQNPSKIDELNDLLNKAADSLTYDKNRCSNHRNFIGTSCFHIYKGNLYNSKSCGNNDAMVIKMKFMFNNPNNFILDKGDFIISEANEKNSKDQDEFYTQKFNFIMKLTDDWEFYNKN